MDTKPAEEKRDRRAYYRDYQRKKYAEKRAEDMEKRVAKLSKEGQLYTLEEKALFFEAKLKEVAAGARRRGKEFQITIKDLFLPDVCPVLGIPLDYGWPVKNLDAVPSIDRINNALGYLPRNVLVISNRANKLKGDASQDELARIATFWTGFFQNEVEVLRKLGEPPPKCLSAEKQSAKREAKKAYWREYQRLRLQRKKQEARLKGEEG